MRKRKIFRMLFILGIWAFGLSALAQDRLITGTVVDSNGEELPGVNIIIKGTTTGTVTDFDGNFQLQVPDAANAVLVLRFIGFEEQEIAVQDRTSITAILQTSSIGLDEVVAIGYGTVKKRDITGSVASVSGDALQAIPVSNVTEAITGKLAGVQISSTEGSPDAEIIIRVRGGGSITGSNAPLYIVDGFPVESISDIASGDIESIDVLKDASSTAIYGSRGANGVIIVTTKSGIPGKVTVNYNAYTGWKKLANSLDVISPYDFAKFQYERALVEANDVSAYTKVYGNYEDMDLYSEVTPNDYQNLIFGRTGFTFNHNFSITGGSEKSTYALSYSHVDEEAIMQRSGFKRNNLSFKLQHKANERVTIDVSMRYSDTEIEGGGANEQNEVSSADSRLKYSILYPPFPVTNLTEGGETDQSVILHHPMDALLDNDRLQKRTSYNMSGSLTWEIVDNLKFRTEVGLDDYRYSSDRFYGPTTYYVKNAPLGDNQNKPAIVFEKDSRETLRNTNTLNYDLKNMLGADHKLSLLLGHEYVFRELESHNTTVHGFPATFSFSDARKLSAQGNANNIENYLFPDDILLSYFGRANYDFKGRYLLSATFRADGSSKFSESNRWGYFPSAAIAWRVSDEAFMDFTSGWLDDMKLRVSYGTAGNNNIPSGQLVQSLMVRNTTWVNNFSSFWAATSTMANPDLKWETTITRNIGLDYTALGGRLNGSFELYQNSTKDLLIRFPTPGTGYIDQYRNMGETENKGVEAVVTWMAVDQRDYGFSISGNIGFNRNEIVSLGVMEDFEAATTWASTEISGDYIIKKGGSVGQMYGYLSDGRYEVSDFEGYIDGAWVLKEGVATVPGVGSIRPGSMKLKNLNPDEDNVVDLNDRALIGDANPLHTGGITLNARAYGFDFSAAFNWSYGNDVYNANKIEYTSTSGNGNRNLLTIMEDGKRWNNLREDGTISNDPAELEAMNANTTMWSPMMTNYIFSDWAVEDGSFLRLNTLTVGYTVPKSLVNRIKVENLRFYASGYNIYTWTNYSGFDPEVSTRRRTSLTPGVDYSAYPKSQSIVFGMNLTF